MKLKILSISKTESGSMELPKQFSEPIRSDLIKRAVEVIRANKRQPYGADPQAGKKHSAELSRRRRKYRGSYGHGISRVPRKIHTRRGTRFFWVAAMAPGTVGGRRAHPPKAEKEWEKKINSKERRKAIRSAISATVNREIVEKRGHKIPQEYPFIIEDKFEDLSKTKEVKEALETLGMKEDLIRALARTFRAGVSRLRGRKYRVPKSVLFVVSKDCKLSKSAKNLPGVEVISVQNLNAEILAPGAEIGRATLFTKSAIERMEKENLFFEKKKVVSQ